MKLTENEPKERTFTLELSETELRVLWAAAGNADFSDTAKASLVAREVAGKYLDGFCDAVRLLGVTP